MLSSLVKDCVIVVDGGCKNNGRKDPVGYGSFKVFVGSQEVRQMKFDLPDCQTNNQAELGAWIMALEYIASDPKRLGLEWTIKGDSALVINALSGKSKIKNAGLKPLFATAVDLAAKVNYRIQQISGDEVKVILGH